MYIEQWLGTRTEKAVAEAQKLAGKLEDAQREAWDAMVAEDEMSSQLEAAQAELQRRHSQAMLHGTIDSPATSI